MQKIVTNDLVPELRDPVIVERIAVRDFSESQDLNESDWRNANATRSASDTRDEIDRMADRKEPSKV